MATAAEIRNKAAKKLGLFGTGQTLNSGISADIDAAYTELHAWLLEMDLATWPVAGAIPSALVEPVVALLAKTRVNEYSVPTEKYQRIMADAAFAEDQIRRVIGRPRRAVTQIENF